ncbi:meprin A subunit beta-like [Bufo bufo]|uniref:meprin A subunit beta-like n=1 Tax=Bufo bufo TaxID=8384 RepID=UPI001ABDF1B1|nr:meprin A subunit beta-like [Bufo bufo]
MADKAASPASPASSTEGELHKLSQAVAEFSRQINELGSRVSDLETRTDELADAIGTDREDIDAHSLQLQALETKIEDLENRSRRGNLRIKGLPESFQDLPGTIGALFSALLPQAQLSQLKMDRIHRALGKPRIPDTPRDVVLKLHYPEMRDLILNAARNLKAMPNLPPEVHIYADLAPTTLRMRREMKPVTQALQQAQVRYRWGFPFALSFQLNSRQYTVHTPAEGIEKLRQAGLKVDCLEKSVAPPRPQCPARVWSQPHSVPHVLVPSLEINAKGVILKAFERYRLKTCINFKPWNGEKNYVSVFKDNGCYSYVGMQNGKQQLSIGTGCDTVEIVQHEVLHALGFYHEQSRSDRDDYVTILWENIQSNLKHNFVSYSDTETTFLDVPYDYTSVMHYPSTAFSANGNPTIQTKKAAFNNLIGKQVDLSGNDVLKLNRLYNCSSSLTFLDSCSFESDDICAMIQSTNDSTDWEYVSSVPEGPNTDHTHMGKGTGYFMYFDTSTGETGNEVILESRLFYPARGFQCLEFFYYHSGNESDQLNIWIKEYTSDSPNGSLTFVNSVTGPPADYWQIHHSKLTAKNKFRFVFQGLKGGGDSAGGISIDDINLSETECPQNVWHIRNFTRDLIKSSLYSPPYYSKDGYAYQISLIEDPWSSFPFNMATYLYLVSGTNDATLQWPCPWRQVTVEFIDQNPNAQERTSNMKSITTDPNEYYGYYAWDNPAVNGFEYTYPNGTIYNITGGIYGQYLFTAEEWLYRRDFLKGGDAFISISMEG